MSEDVARKRWADYEEDDDYVPTDDPWATLDRRSWADVVRRSTRQPAYESALCQPAYESPPCQPAYESACDNRGGLWTDVVGPAHLIKPEVDDQLLPLPGDYVGIRAVHSILMSATQMNLSHFHTAGMHSNLPSFRPIPSPAEALDGVYKNTSMTFESTDDVYALRKHIVGVTLKSFVKSVGGSFTVLPDRENVWYDVLKQPMSDGNVIRLYIHFLKMRNHGLTLRDLAHASFGNDVVTRVSPDFMGMIDIEVPNDHLSQWLSRMGTVVCGTQKVRSCEKVEKAAVTHGTDVLALSKVASVDCKTITSNDVNEVETLYGVEAAASVLCELTHSRVVSDFMTRTGGVSYFTKNSLEVAKKGLLTSMGFERPKNDIKEVVTHPHIYETGRPSIKESIMTGTPAACHFSVRKTQESDT